MPRLPQPTRARRNKSVSRATLFEREPDEVEVPALPPMRLVERKQKFRDTDGILQTESVMAEQPWRLETMEWWQDIWASPMSAEFHSSDVHGLLRLACLVDDFWRNPTSAANSEIRLAQQPYGLTPLDRRRLEWSIANAEGATAKRPAPPAEKRDDGGRQGDPRLWIC